MSQSERIISGRYRVIYPISEHAGILTSYCRDEESGSLVYVAECPITTNSQVQRLGDVFTRLQGLAHPQLARLVTYTSTEQEHIAVCAAPSGHPLSQALQLQNGTFNSGMVVLQLGKCLELLSYLHGQTPALYVGSVRPEDIIVQDDGQWCMLPFVLARPLSGSDSPYQASELKGDEPRTPASDIYSVAAIAYLAVTGHAPASAEQQQAGNKLIPPRTYNPQISEMFEAVLLRALQEKSYNRYQNATEMRVAIDTLQILREREKSLQTVVAPMALQVPAPADQSLGAILPGNYVPPTAAPPPTAVTQSNFKLGCLIAAAVTLAIVAIMLCIVLLLVVPGSPFRSLSGGFLASSFNIAATTTPAPSTSKAIVAATTTPVPTVVGSNQRIDERTAGTLQVSEIITNTTFGPVAWSPDGQSLAITAGDEITLHDGQEFAEYARLSGHLGNVTSLSWSPDSRLLASGASNDPVVHVWDVTTGSEAFTLNGHEGWIRNVAFSPDGTFIASGSTDLSVRIWDIQTKRTVFTMNGHTDFINGLAWSPDGTLLASASRDGSVRLWNTRTGMPVTDFSFQTAINQESDDGTRYWATGLVWSADGKSMYVGATDGSITVINATTGATQRTLRGHRSWITIRGLQLSADQRTLYSSGLDGLVTVWDVASGTMKAQYAEHELGIFGISLDPVSNRLVSTSDQEGRLIMWDMNNEQVIGTLRIGTGIPVMLTYPTTDDVMAISGYNSMIRLEQTRSQGTLYLTAANDVAQSIAFFGDNRFALITNDNGVNIYTPDATVPTALTGVDGTPIAVAAPSNGDFLVVSTETGIQLWRSDTVGAPITLQSALSNVIEITFSADGSLMALRSGGEQAGYEIWNMTTLQRRITADERTYGVHFFSDNQRVVVITEQQTIEIRPTDGTDALQTLEAPESGGFVAAVPIPGSTLLAAADLIGGFAIVDTEGTIVASYAQPDGITALAVNTAGTEVAIGLRDGSVVRYVVP
jgi:WD40 repeat protein